MIKNTAVQITTIISVVVLIIAFSTLYIFNSAVNSGKNSVNVYLIGERVFCQAT